MKNETMQPVPAKNRKYNCFDDGKISESRHYTVRIKEAVPFGEIDKETRDLWESEVEHCNWLYALKTDYFVKTEDDKVFVRTVGGGWFSIGGFLDSGLLDIDGSLTKSMRKYEKG